MGKCKHCKDEFDLSDKPNGWMANHSRWCAANPKRTSYGAAAVNAMNAKRKDSGITNQFVKAKLEGSTVIVSEITRKKLSEAFTGRRHRDDSKKLMSEKALASPHRRVRRGCQMYNGVLMDSSWEVALAARLDFLGIVWIRPKPLRWADSFGIEHNYFPDFYLPDLDLFLDPKNPHVINIQRDKLECLQQQYANIRIIDSLDGCKNFQIPF